ncbi:MAG: hypothetical protein LBJ38_00705 [Oscillospiraceae bacterium]|nr:hypothetical protein [Oscillospiraceae bacterium]
MTIAKLKDEYRAAAGSLHDRVVELTQEYKTACKKEQTKLKRRIVCLYDEIRALLKTANSIDAYCKRNGSEG